MSWPSQTSVSGSNRNPLKHWQVKLPGVFLHRPLSQSRLFIIHSLMSEKTKTKRWNDYGRSYKSSKETCHLPTQFLPERSTSKPVLQVHLYVRCMFSHTPFWQMSGSRAHSLMSEKAEGTLWAHELKQHGLVTPLLYIKNHWSTHGQTCHYLFHRRLCQSHWGTEPGTQLQ